MGNAELWAHWDSGVPVPLHLSRIGWAAAIWYSVGGSLLHWLGGKLQDIGEHQYERCNHWYFLNIMRFQGRGVSWGLGKDEGTSVFANYLKLRSLCPQSGRQGPHLPDACTSEGRLSIPE